MVSILQMRRRMRYDWLLYVRIRLFFFFFICASVFSFIVYWIQNPKLGLLIAMLINIEPMNIQEFVNAGKIFSSTITPWENFAHLIILLSLVAGSYACTHIVMKTITRGYNDQRRFASVVAHELRTPLSVLKTTAEITQMRGDNLTDEEVRNLLDNIVFEVDRMSEIIRFFLRFSLRDKSAKFSMAPLSVPEAIDSAMRLVFNDATKKGLTMKFADHGTSYNIWGNKVAFEDMVVNLLKNSIQHTPCGGEIKIEVHNTKNGKVECVFSDNGSGIASNDIPHIFKPFYRKDVPQGKGKIYQSSVGIGLSIVKDIVSMHHGNIYVESRQGSGTRFRVVFPHA